MPPLACGDPSPQASGGMAELWSSAC